MTLILDAGGVSALAGQRARLAELRRRGHWPPLVLTSDPDDLVALAQHVARPVAIGRV